MAIIKYVPNTLSIMRIILSSSLLVLWLLLPAGFVLSPLFLVIYTFAGITDMIDGPIARKFNVVTPLGANLDGIADYFFVAIAIFLIVPALNIYPVLIVTIVVMLILMKGAAIFIGYIRHKQVIMLHTYGAKTGAMLAFLLPLIIHFTGFDENILVVFMGMYVFLFLSEEILVNTVSAEADRDVTSLRQAWKVRKEKKRQGK